MEGLAMKLEDVRKQYNDGLFLREEAVQVIEALGNSKGFAEKYLDGFTKEAARTLIGAGRSNLLVLPR